jgi:hypothetical protein
VKQDSRQRRPRRKGDFLAPHKCDISGCGAGHLQSRLHGRREALAPCLFFDVAAGTSRIDPDDVSDEMSGKQGATGLRMPPAQSSGVRSVVAETLRRDEGLERHRWRRRNFRKPQSRGSAMVEIISERMPTQSVWRKSM